MERLLGIVVIAAGVLVLVVGILIAVFLPAEGRGLMAIGAQLEQAPIPAEAAPIMMALGGVITLAVSKISTYFEVVGLFIGILLSVIGAGLIFIGYLVHGLMKIMMGAFQALAGVDLRG